MINRSDLIKWLNGCVYKGKNGEGVRMFALRHLDADERTDAVDEWPHKQGLDTADLADDIILSATRDAIGLEGVEKYVVEAYFGTSKTRGKRYTATIDGGAVDRHDSETHSGRTEPAGPRGESMQLRRHVENMHRLSVGGANETIRILRSENESLRGMVEKLMSKHFDVINTYEELADKKHQRNIDLIKIQNEEKLKEQLLGQVVPLIPVLGMKAVAALGMGDDKSAQAAAVSTPEAMLFRAIAKHIIDNQDTVMPALFQAFGSNPGLIAGIKELVDKYGVEEPPAASAQ